MPKPLNSLPPSISASTADLAQAEATYQNDTLFYVPEHEHIAREASDLNEFLGRHELLDRYFSALGDYLGTRAIHQDSFRIILDQLKGLLPKIPGLAARLWETDKLGTPFLIPLGIKAFGRNVNAERWTVYLARWRQQLVTNAEAYLSIPNINKRAVEFHAYLAALGEEIERVHQLALSEKKKTGILLRANFYRNLRSDKKLVAAASYFLIQALADDLFVDKLRGDADLILNTIHQLLLQTEQTIPGLAEFSFLTPFVRDLVPDLSKLLADFSLFPIATRTARTGKEVAVGSADSIVYLFRPVTRRLHGIWKGITMGDCVGGDPRWGAQNATPERWGTIALEGSQLHYIERIVGSAIRPHRREFEGFVQVVPIRWKRNRQTYASVEFMSRAITKRALLTDSAGKSHVVSTFDLWVEKYAKLKAPGWTGLVIGQSNALNHDGVLDHIRRKPHFLLGQRIEAGEFEHVDPLAKAIVSASSRKGSARVFGGNMIFDGVVPDARQLTVLREDVVDVHSPMQAYETYLRLLNHPEVSVSWWASLSLLRAQDPGHLSLKLALDRFPLAMYRGLSRVYGPLFDFIKRKRIELQGLPLPPPPTSELWAETTFEISQWHVRQQTGQVRQHTNRSSLTRAEKERLMKRVQRLLVEAVRWGRTMGVRGASAVALGRLQIKDLSLLKILCHAARPRRTYRERIRDGRVHIDSLFALGELGWEHPLVSETLADNLLQRASDAEEVKLLSLDVVRRLRCSSPRLVQAMAHSLEQGTKPVREKTLAVCRETRLISEVELERLSVRGVLADASSLPYEKIEATRHFSGIVDHDDPKDIAYLESRLDEETEHSVREALIQTLSHLGVVNVWTLLHATRLSLEGRSSFLRTVSTRPPNPAKLQRAMEQAESLEPSFATHEFVRELKVRFLTGRARNASRPLRAFLLSFTQETVFSLVLVGFLMLETVASFGFLFRSYVRLAQQNSEMEISIEQLNNFEGLIVEERYKGLLNALPGFLKSADPRTYHSEKEFDWSQKLKEAIGELQTVDDQKKRDETIKTVKRLTHRIELEYHRRSSENRRDKNSVIMLYTTINLIANILGFFFAALSTRTVRKAIRQRLQAERSIRESEERFRLSITGIKDHAIFTVSEEGTIVTWNDAAEGMTGYSANEITGKKLSVLFSHRELKAGAIAHELRTCQKVGWYQGENSIARKDGSHFAGYLTLTALKNEKGGTRGIVAVVRKNSKAAA